MTEQSLRACISGKLEVSPPGSPDCGYYEAGGGGEGGRGREGGGGEGEGEEEERKSQFI